MSEHILKLRGRPVPKGRPRAGIAGGWSRWRPHRLLAQLKSLLVDLSMMLDMATSADEFKAAIIKNAEALQALNNLPEGEPKSYMFTPKSTREFEQAVALQAKQIIRQKLLSEIAVEILLVFNKRNFGDIDNYSKSILDALQLARVFENDKQIADL